MSKIKNFAEAVLLDDSLDDWNLVRDFGEFLVRLDADEILGHALLARACRHIGDRRRAREELGKCRALASQGLSPGQREIFLPLLSEEEKHLSEEPLGV